MSPDRWQRMKAIFEEVASAPPQSQQALLAGLCGGEETLRADVEKLLRNAAREDGFLPSDSALTAGAVLSNRFELMRRLGEGGMGEVWSARDRQTGETIAVKVIHESIAANPAGVDRFKRELLLARKIAHPNICRVNEIFKDTIFEDASVTPARLFLTMEFLDGETLAARLKREQRVMASEAMNIMRQLTAGLAAAHAAGVIHRDLKPANIMLAGAPGAGAERAVIMDFGLARAESPAPSRGVTEAGLIMGTPEYMAPEQIRGDAPSPATDLYALGLIFYEMLAGEPALGGRTTMESWMRRAREGPPKLSKSVEGLSPRADAVIARCLAYEAADRFASASEVWAELETRRGLPWEKPDWRSARWAAAAVLVLAVGGAAWRWWPMERPPAAVLRWYDEAQRDLAEGATARAASQLKRVIEAAPKFAAAHAAMAETRLELDQGGLARESILRAAEMAPDRSRLPKSEALYVEGVSRLILRDCPGAIASLRGRVAAMPDADRAYGLMGLARAFEKCDKPVEAAASLAEALKIDPRNAAALARSGWLASRQKDLPAAGRLLGQAEAAYRERSNYVGVGEVLLMRGALEAEHDELEASWSSLAKAMEIARTAGSAQQQINVTLQQAVVERKRGNLAASSSLTNDALETARKYDLETLTLRALFVSADVNLVKNQLDAATADANRALDIAERYRDEGNQAQAKLARAKVQLRQGDLAAAEGIRYAKDYYSRTRQPKLQAGADALMGQFHMLQAAFSQASAEFDEQLKLLSAEGQADQELDARGNLAWALTESGDLARGLEEYKRVLEVNRSAGRKRRIAIAVLNVSEGESRLGRSAEASASAAEAQALMKTMDADAWLESRLKFVEGANAARRGDCAVARLKLGEVVDTRGGDSVDRLFQARVLLCGCLSRCGDPAKGIPYCEHALGAGRPSYRARLALAEAQLLAKNREQAAEEAAAAWPESEKAGAREDMWRARVVQTAAGKDFSTDVARLLADLRLRLGAAHASSWESRADIGWLVKLTK